MLRAIEATPAVLLLLLWWPLVLAPLAAPGADGAIAGTLKLQPLPAIPIKASRYQGREGVRPGPPEPPVAVVYLEIPEGSPRPEPTPVVPVVRIDQQHFQFTPALQVLRTGTRVEFPNKDGDYHSVFSYSKTKRFDLGRFRNGEEPPAVVMDRPGVVQVFCEIHDHMRSTILVVDTPWFTRTGTNGVFQLTGIPSGEYTLRAWQSEQANWTRKIVVKPGETVRVDLP